MKNYLSLIKFSHTVFALPFALVGFFTAVVTTRSPLNWELFGLVLVCMVTARSAAMAFNRYIDREFDAANVRTAIREIPAGIIQPKNALFFVIFNCVLFLIATYFINPLCFYLAPVALAVVLGYSYTKRFTALCHLILGIGLGLAPVGAYLAVAGHFADAPVFLGFAVLAWVAGFDIIYALQDEEFDRSQGLRSIPVALGTRGALRLSRFLHVCCIALVVLAGSAGDYSCGYWLGVVVFVIALWYQHSLVSPTDLSKINLAFFTTNGIASVVFGALVLLDLFFCR